jgi:hypothetical protein
VAVSFSAPPISMLSTTCAILSAEGCSTRTLATKGKELALFMMLLIGLKRV